MAQVATHESAPGAADAAAALAAFNLQLQLFGDRNQQAGERARRSNVGTSLAAQTVSMESPPAGICTIRALDARISLKRS